MPANDQKKKFDISFVRLTAKEGDLPVFFERYWYCMDYGPELLWKKHFRPERINIPENIWQSNTWNVNFNYYIQILQENLLPNVNLGETFQHDNVPAHNAFAIKVSMAINAVYLLENWPAQPPDLKIIKNSVP